MIVITTKYETEFDNIYFRDISLRCTRYILLLLIVCGVTKCVTIYVVILRSGDIIGKTIFCSTVASALSWTTHPSIPEEMADYCVFLLKVLIAFRLLHRGTLTGTCANSSLWICHTPSMRGNGQKMFEDFYEL